jgi:hypothetical protein
MTTCAQCPVPTPPTLPDIFTSITIPPIPGLQGAFCCSYSLVDPGLVAAAQKIVNVATASVGAEANSIVDMVNGEVMAVALPILLKLKALKVRCPLDGSSP